MGVARNSVSTPCVSAAPRFSASAFLDRTYHDGAGRMEQETQLSKDDQILNRIVYSYDSSGKQTGYSVFDGNGKLLGQTSTPTPSPAGRAKKK